jgi:hypothetical protein
MIQELRPSSLLEQGGNDLGLRYLKRPLNTNCVIEFWREGG